MREIDLHDDFWPGALDALATSAPIGSLREPWPGLAELLDGLVADAKREPLLVGLRLATPGRNPRLFSLLAGACLARAGIRTLLLDLSPDTRWLEQLLGADFKEGLVDHLRFGVPLERCVRSTALDRFSAMSGGVSFLAGSPLDDAPGFRAALDRLRQRHRVVLVTLPPPLETGDGTGIAALCAALVTVEERDATASLAGSERAVVRLTGDPEAARDLAHLTHRFLGPLTTVVAGMARARGPEAFNAELAARPVAPMPPGELEPHAPARETAPIPTPAPRPAAREPEPRPARDAEPPPIPIPAPRPAALDVSPADEELAFLRGLEGRPAEEREPETRPAFWERGRGTIRSSGAAGKPAEPSAAARSISRRRLVAATAIALVVLIAVGVSSRGIASDVVAWVLGESEHEPGYEEPGGEMIALDQSAAAASIALPVEGATAVTDSSATLAGSLDEGGPAAPEPAPPAPARRVPYSLHVGSYQNVESGMRVMAEVERAGLPAFLAPVSLPGKGRWQRVYVGSFADSVVARHALERLQREGVVEEGTVRSTPWAFDLGTYPSLAAARAEAEALRRKGITTYVTGEETPRLYAGAYQTREEAELFARTLETALDGRTATLTLREE